MLKAWNEIENDDKVLRKPKRVKCTRVIYIQNWSSYFCLNLSLIFSTAFEIQSSYFITWHRRGSSLLVFLSPTHLLFISNYMCFLIFTQWICTTSESSVDSKIIKSRNSVVRLLGFKSQLCSLSYAAFCGAVVKQGLQNVKM